MKEIFYSKDLISKNKTEEEVLLHIQPDLKNTNDVNKLLIEVWKEDSVAAEQYRILRTHILKATQNNASKVFLISSAVHGEGKTLTSINLAISIARGLDEIVLLIDADLRKPNVSSMLGLEKETKGLAEYLAYGGDFLNYITKTSIPKLSLIPSGLPPSNPSELIHSNQMVDLIRQLKHQFDNQIIIIDSPPLIPVTDSVILSSLADAVLIVIKAFKTHREKIYEAIDKIGNKEKILGLILNECEFSKFKYDYYNYYIKDIKK